MVVRKGVSMAVSSIINLFSNRFTDTIFYKKDNDLEKQIAALQEVTKIYPNNSIISKKLTLCKLGLKGEEEIEFELKNANIGMYVLHDINIKYEDLKAQIDYIVITPAKVYFIECKNLAGNITVNSKGEFIREWYFQGKKITEGIYSPLTQAERHVDIFKKIWKKRNTGLINQYRYNHMDDWYVPLVVMANSKNVLNIKYAPKEVKNKIVKSDNLVNILKKDIESTERECLWSKNDMEKCAISVMENYNNNLNRNYVQEYIEMIEKNIKTNTSIERKEEKASVKNDEEVRTRLIEFRKEKSKKMNIPAYYVFTNDELEKILEFMPTNIDELRKLKILPQIKIKTHGEEIINIIKEK